MGRRSRAAVASMIALLAACKDGPPPQQVDAATIRLAKATLSATPLDAGALSDRDTTTGAQVSGPVAIHLDFDHEVEIRAVKLFVQGDVEVSGDALGRVVLSGRGEWVRYALPGPARGRRLSLTVAPVAGTAWIGEVEAWGGGQPRAPKDVAALARGSARTDPQLENAIVLRGTVTDATLQPAGAQQGQICTSTRFPAFAARAVRRAYLTYEANVQRAVVLSRSLNGAAPAGGFWIASGAEARTVTDELDPERLTGHDEVQLCVPGQASAPVNVSGLRLVLLLDDGTEAWDRGTRRLLAAATDGDDATFAELGPGRHELALDRPVSVDSDEARVLQAAEPQGAVGVLEATGWTELGSVTWGAPAPLGISGRTIRGAHLDFGAAGAKLAEVRLAGSGVGRRVGAPRIVLTYPETQLVDGREVGERFDGKAFVAGWAESPSGPGLVEVGGARMGDAGTFATEVERPIQATGSWAVIVRARFPDGTELTRTIEFDDDRGAEVAAVVASAGTVDERFGREGQTGWGDIDAENGGKVKLGTDVELEAPPGAVPGRTSIGISRKGAEVMPPLDSGMVNVTAPAHNAYRFLPKGQKFAKPVKVKIPYDPALLPEGTAPEEIQTYFYDEASSRWQALPRVELSRELQRVTSETTHFTFMINAVLVLPDHPGPASFNPNSIKDLKAADPTANVDFIEAPQANNQGTAQLSFPIRLPKARGAYQPSLRLSYDSGAGNGWVGVGWTLPVSSVAVDTKYGVPYYDGTERYVLDGAQLVPGDAAPGACLDQSDGRLYHARVEREYKRIVRCGGGVDAYWFEVTDRSGVLSLYGTTTSKRLARPAGVPGVQAIGEWYLDRVIDLNGNLTVYGYDFDSEKLTAVRADGTPDGTVHGEPFTQAYLRSITYSGRAPRTGTAALTQVDEVGAYRVELRSQRSGRYHTLRPDVISSARTGFKVLTRRRLESISVALVEGATTRGIREYRLAYEKGSFGKSRLEKIAAYGAWEPGQTAPLFYEHGLRYFDVDDGANGQPAHPFGDPEPLEFADGGDDQAMSRTESWGYGVHGYVGIGPIAPSSVSIGIRGGFNQTKSTNVSTLVDVNGDTLPDRIRLTSSGAQVRFNAGDEFFAAAPPSDPYAGLRISSIPLSTLGHSSSTSFNLALQAKAFSISLSYGKSWFSSDTPDFLVDVDGDGLVDVIDRGKVLFNQTRNGSPVPGCTLPQNNPTTFCFDPTKWVRQISSVPVQPDLTADLSQDPEIAATVEELDAQFRPADTLLEWLAPYDGAVDVAGTLSFSRAGAAQIDPSWDGVRLSIEKVTVVTSADGSSTYYREPVTEPVTIRLGELTVPTPIYVPAVEMTSGSRLYFVLSTLASFPVAKPGPFPLEEVSFSPTISYANAIASVGTFELRDPTNAPLYRFDALQDFRLAGSPLSAVTVPADGTLEIRSVIRKAPCADDVRVCVQKFGPDDELRDVSCRAVSDPVAQLWGRELESSSLETVPVDVSVSVAAGEKLVFRIETDLSIDPNAVDWNITGRMATVCVEDGACGPTPADQQEEYSFVADAYVPLHLPVDPRTNGEKLASARPRKTPVLAFVATEPGTLHVENYRDYAAFIDSPTGTVFAIRKLDGLVKQDGAVQKGRLHELLQHVDIEVEPGDHVFFEAHSESPFDLHGPVWDGADPGAWVPGNAWAPYAWFQGPTGNRAVAITVNETVDGLWRSDRVLGILSPFGGGFHGWRYGVWGGPNDRPIDPALFEQSASGGEMSSDEQTAVDQGLERMDPDDPNASRDDRQRAERVQPLVPRRNGSYFGKGRPGLVPREPAFVSRDGNVFVTLRGTMHAGRDGGYVEGGEEAGSGESVVARFRMGKMSRASVGTSVQGGLSALFAGLSIGGGNSRTKADVRDMNGDGIVDVVSSSASGKIDVRLTDPRSLAQRGGFSLGEGGDIQDNKDLTVSVNLGISDAVRSFVPETSTVGSVVAMFPGIGGGLGVNYSATTGELADVNGDGLPDAVRRVPGEAGFHVRLNLGTSFASHEDFVPAARWGTASLDDLVGKLGSKINSAGGRRMAALLGVLRNGTYRAVADPNMVRRTTALSINDNIGKGFGERFQAVVNWESSIAATSVALIDVNGDGLPDYVRKGPKDTQLKVMLNTGYGFSEERAWSMTEWPAHVAQPWIKSKAWIPTTKTVLDWVAGPNPMVDSIEANGSYSERPTVGFVFTYSIPIWLIRLHFSVGGDWSPKKLAGLDLSMQDVNGDGLPDHVLKAEKLKGKENRAVYVRLNGLKKGNLLKTVTRPLGGAIDLDYVRTAPTVDMSGGRWVLTKVVERDGRGGAAGSESVAVGHDIVTTYGYWGGYHDRAERDFLGFETVERVQADGTRVTQHYFNSTFAKKGLVRSEETWDASDRLFVLSENEYATPASRLAATAQDCAARTPFFLNAFDYCQSFEVLPTKTTRTHYEGMGAAKQVGFPLGFGVSTTQELLEYDTYGNVTRFHDAGDDADPNDDLWATVTYVAGDDAFSMYSVSRPQSVVVRSAPGTTGGLLRMRSATYGARGNLLTFTEYATDGEPGVVTDVEWNADGMLKTFKAPAVGGRRYTTTYEYDALTRTQPVKTTNAHGYTSSASYDLRFGEVETTIDVNGNQTRRVFDAFGRGAKLFGPKSPAAELVTITFPPLVGDGAAKGAVGARTANKLPIGGAIETVVFMDGLRRVIQTKKTALVSASGVDDAVTPGWSVSGQQVFDSMGRVWKQGLTFFDPEATTGFVKREPLQPTITTYDALGRPRNVTRPADSDFKLGTARTAVTANSYDLGTPREGGVRRLRTSVTDANGHVRIVYRALADRVVAVEERPTEPGTPASVVTHYDYNPIGELTRIADSNDHLTTIAYDLLGRRTQVVNPDTGQIDFFYDAMGNMVRKQDANLRRLTGPTPYIRYEYDLDLLVGIRYPEGSVTMDVKFEYGAPGAPGNGAGRVVRVVDDAGEETREYGALGEVVLTRRTLRPLKPLDPPMVFETRFDLDEWGRTNWIRYPDGETVRYEYDAGGLLKYARGDRPSTVHYPATSEVYLQFMTYDEFGQRRVLKLGNGAVTRYAYHPENHRLARVETVSAGRKLQNVKYGYDLVGNVTFESNGLGPPTDTRSGDVNYEFLYDSLDRLDWAKATADARTGVTDQFETKYAYSVIHNMTSNKQVHKVTSVTDLGTEIAYPPHTNHDLAYAYDPAKPHQATQIGDMFLTYDTNGNTATECRDHADPSCSVNHDHYRVYGWTEENRLASVIDGGGKSITRFIYDAAGDRLVKYGRGGASITIGQFFNVKGRTAATKHVFAGAVRLASKLLPPGDFASPTLGAPVPTIATGTNRVGDGSPNENGCVPSDYQPQKCPILVNGEPVVPYPFQDTKVRPATYYYHADHLGSTSWVTDQNGNVHEHVEYFPYGETWRDQVSDRDGASVKGQRFLFTGKEFDEETGLYYFGARYFDPVRARWTSTDPAFLRQAMPGADRVSAGLMDLPTGLSVYAYVAWRPLAFVDPDGLAKRGDVIIFLWDGKDRPGHAAIVSKVDEKGNPTQAYGFWGVSDGEDRGEFKEKDLRGLEKNIAGTADLGAVDGKPALTSRTVEDVVKIWSAGPRKTNLNWHPNGYVCVDVVTSTEGLGGPTLRKAMTAEFAKDEKRAEGDKQFRSYSGIGRPKANDPNDIRRVPRLYDFLKQQGRLTPGPAALKDKKK